jgi:branched-chain amino acid transport system substrate-binding protein
LLASKPDGVLLVANSVDAALLAQQLRRINPSVAIATSEWSATERLIELGGRAVEGITIAQFLDRQSQQPSYIAFRKAYLERFGREPGFAGLTAFDATNVVMDGLASQDASQTLKQTLLARKSFPGAQSPVVFDAYGDASRETFMTTIENGMFVVFR